MILRCDADLTTKTVKKVAVPVVKQVHPMSLSLFFMIEQPCPHKVHPAASSLSVRVWWCLLLICCRSAACQGHIGTDEDLCGLQPVVPPAAVSGARFEVPAPEPALVCPHPVCPLSFATHSRLGYLSLGCFATVRGLRSLDGCMKAAVPRWSHGGGADDSRLCGLHVRDVPCLCSYCRDGMPVRCHLITGRPARLKGQVWRRTPF